MNTQCDYTVSMITIITGAPGTGKTKTAQYLFEHTEKSAYIDGDWLQAINPDPHGDTERLLRYKNIATLAKNYYEAGYTTIFIAFVYTSNEHLAQQINLLDGLDEVKVFALVPNEETLRQRHAEDKYKREPINSSLELNAKIGTLENVVAIDNSGLSIAETCETIKQKLSQQVL